MTARWDGAATPSAPAAGLLEGLAAADDDATVAAGGNLLVGAAWLASRSALGGLFGVALHVCTDQRGSLARSFANGAAAGAGLTGIETGGCKILAAWQLDQVRERYRGGLPPALRHFQGSAAAQAARALGSDGGGGADGGGQQQRWSSSSASSPTLQQSQWEFDILSIARCMPSNCTRWAQYTSLIVESRRLAYEDQQTVTTIATWWPAIAYTSQRRRARELLHEVDVVVAVGREAGEFCEQHGVLLHISEAVAQHPLRDHAPNLARATAAAAAAAAAASDVAVDHDRAARQPEHKTTAEIVYGRSSSSNGGSGVEGLFPYLTMERALESTGTALAAKLRAIVSSDSGGSGGSGGSAVREQHRKTATVAIARELQSFGAEFLTRLRQDPELHRERRDEVMHARQEEQIKLEKASLEVERAKLAAAVAAATALREKQQAISRCAKALEELRHSVGRQMAALERQHGRGGGRIETQQQQQPGQQGQGQDERAALLRGMRDLIRRAERQCEQ